MKSSKQNIGFIAIILCLITITSLVILFKAPVEISNEENRTLTTFASLKETSYLDGSFQSTFENAYTDQFIGRNIFVQFKKKIDFRTKNMALNGQSDYILNKMPDVNVNQLGSSDWMINMIVEGSEENQNRFKQRALEINALQERHPDVNVYVYMPTQVHDTNIFDEANNIIGGGPILTSILKQNLTVPYAQYELDSLDDYKLAYYKSDHHPNNVGADLFYQQIIKLIKPEDTPLTATGTDCHVGTTFYGTFASQTGFVGSPDEFCIYTYDLPTYDALVDGVVQDDYTTRQDFTSIDVAALNEQHPYYYNYAYKIYDPIMEIDTHQTDKDNLLIIGDSYSNSILDLLASHFNKTYRVAPYNVYIQTGSLFNYDKFIEENDIDTVLFMYTFENYYYVDEWGDRYMQNEIMDGGN